MKKTIAQKGFTLVELVTVIIVIGILAVTILPRFSGSQDFEAHSFRVQLISALRLTQQRAMQNTDFQYCNQLVIASDKYGVPDVSNCAVTSFAATFKPDATGMIVDDRYTISFSPAIVQFDTLGRPLKDCFGGCDIIVSSAVESLKITIDAQGYIYANDA